MSAGIGPQVDHHYRDAMCKYLIICFALFIGGSKCIDRINKASEWNVANKVTWEMYLNQSYADPGDCILFKRTTHKYVMSYSCEQEKE